MDLALAGVRAELGEASLGVVGWDARQLPAQAVVATATPKVVPVEVKKPELPPEKVEEAGEVWAEGVDGGVVLVVQGGKPQHESLIDAMMAAVGCETLPRAWVGAMGKVDAKDVVAKVNAMSPQRVLVLGQGALGILTGKNTGVEGWQAAGGPALAGLEGVVGVTYPPEMLVRQPLFKRLAWQHLLAWRQRFGG